MTQLVDLVARRNHLVETLAQERDPTGHAHLELGILSKLVGGWEGIPAAFAHLHRALELLPEDAVEARQKALFVLALTHGDVLDPVSAVNAFEAVETIAPTRIADAAVDYAHAYREHWALPPAKLRPPGPPTSGPGVLAGCAARRGC